MRAFPQEEGRRLGAGEAARLGHDALEHGGELALAADCDPELQEVFDQLGAVFLGGRTHDPGQAQIPHPSARDVHDTLEKARGGTDLHASVMAEIQADIYTVRSVD